MKKIIDGKDTPLGRIASYSAKEAIKGDEIIILNCEKVIITGNKKDILKKFEEKKSKMGSGQRGPKHSRNSEKIVKRAIRGMIPSHKKERGKKIYKSIRCYEGVPKEFKNENTIILENIKENKFIYLEELTK